MLELLSSWPRLITDDPSILSGFQRHSGDPGKRLRPGKYPCHDGGGGGDFRAADRAVSGVPQQDHGGRIAEEGQKDETMLEKDAVLCDGVRLSDRRC